MHFVVFDVCNFFTQIRLSVKLLPSGAAGTGVPTLKANAQTAPAHHATKWLHQEHPEE